MFQVTFNESLFSEHGTSSVTKGSISKIRRSIGHNVCAEREGLTVTFASYWHAVENKRGRKGNEAITPMKFTCRKVCRTL